ncbi:MAG: hypothetical protein U5N21_00615 [Rhodococcus sp. (in: high G+C Gram-positive bacteria)]|nr:hypothetical protein [Rhodococcus sp. (in: high G+C Gram-positive bacteria)]
MTRKRFEYVKVAVLLIFAAVAAWGAGALGSVYYAGVAMLLGAVSVFVAWRVDKFETE